jgi:hypothetical protein
VNPLLFSACLLLVYFFICPHDAPAVFPALEAFVAALLIGTLPEFASLDEGTFGCLLDDTPRVLELD